MKKHRRKWTAEEKEKIILYSDEHGISKAVREFDVSSVSIYNWKEKFDQMGKEGLNAGSMNEQERELKLLRRENLALKRLVAEKELAIQVKDSLLKKTQFLKK